MGFAAGGGVDSGGEEQWYEMPGRQRRVASRLPGSRKPGLTADGPAVRTR